MITRRSFLTVSALISLAACGPRVESGTPVTAAHAFSSSDISVVTRGSGPDVILIHGLAGHIGVWDESAEALEDATVSTSCKFTGLAARRDRAQTPWCRRP
jgi:pimeloyl-ACP methyl ester carboxylesterase